jgi:hypothetical protein
MMVLLGLPTAWSRARPHHGPHDPARAGGREDAARTSRSCPRCSSCAWRTRCSSTATARSTPTRPPSSSPTSRSPRPKTAAEFGVEPRVAMLSYSTGASGTGSDVEKVKQATALVRERAPELPVEGPIQYDAAIDVAVARTKLPGLGGRGPGDGLHLPRPQHRQQHLQGRAALGRRRGGGPGAPGPAPAGQRPVPRGHRPRHRQHGGDHRHPGPAEKEAKR